MGNPIGTFKFVNKRKENIKVKQLTEVCGVYNHDEHSIDPDGSLEINIWVNNEGGCGYTGIINFSVKDKKSETQFSLMVDSKYGIIYPVLYNSTLINVSVKDKKYIVEISESYAENLETQLPINTKKTNAKDPIIEESKYNQYMKIAEEFAPMIYLHSKDNYRPGTVDTFLNACDLYFRTNEFFYEKGVYKKDDSSIYNCRTTRQSQFVVPNVCPKGSDYKWLSSQYCDSSFSGAKGGDSSNQFFLFLKDTNLIKGDPLINKGTESNSPCYVHFLEKPNGSLNIQYWFFYPNNGNLESTIFNLSMGHHIGDWENIIINIENPISSPKITSMYLSEHGDMIKTTVDEINFYEKTQHPIIYSALDSHANYNSAGRFTRGKKPDDYTNEGPKWLTWNYLINTGSVSMPSENCNWLWFNGRWGESYKYKPYYSSLFKVDYKGASSPAGPAFQSQWYTLLD